MLVFTRIIGPENEELLGLQVQKFSNYGDKEPIILFLIKKQILVVVISDMFILQ
jgi:hypothetical protein